MEYIDTKTHDTLKRSVMGFLKLSENEMEQIFETIYYETEKEPWEWVGDFLLDYIGDETIDYIQMFHLTRRLNGTDLRDTYNLGQLLLSESPISEFFRRHKVTFAKGERHIELYYRGKIEPLDNEFKYSNGNMYYVRWRLGYNTEQDYCVNGFAFRDHIEKTDYYRSLSRCPELVQNIEWLLGANGMIEDYYNNSKYYCIEYLIPLSEVIFDINNSPSTVWGKTKEFLKVALLRLYDEWRGSDFSFDENYILRLADDAKIKPEWFVRAEEIED